MNQYGENDAQDRGPDAAVSPSAALLGYCVSRIKRGRDVRDQKYGQRWDEYTRLWRGFWASEDKNQNSERSKLIAPALQQAIEMATAEIEEACFSRVAWFDIEDDIADEQKDDAIAYRDQLLEDFSLGHVEDDCAKVFLLGALYGTGIGKLNIRESQEMVVGPDGRPQKADRIVVTVDAVRPDEFVIDPSATNVDEALFCAHEFVKPLHTIKAKQAKGIYAKGELRGWNGNRGDTTGTGETSNVQPLDDGVLIQEFFGKVPARWVQGAEEAEGDDLVEAIVTIANEAMVLRAVASPYTYKDRPIIAYQHDTVPGEFWGRGVAEKGYNPQKALDAELRARIDALALITAPMLGADMGRLPRNPDMRIRPGKLFFTRGRPSEVIEPIGFPPNSIAASFQHSADLERMVQMGTGSMDSATPIGINGRNETMGGMSMIQTGFLKRSKRTMQNIERQFLSPLVRRSLWRYMQFEPERYPADMLFVVKASMGIMAKEVENAQLTQLMGYVPPENPAFGVLLTAILDNTASSEKAAIKQAIAAMTAPPTPEQQQQQEQMQQLQMAGMMAEVRKTNAEAALKEAQAQHEVVEASLEDDYAEIAAANVAVSAGKAKGDVKRQELAVQKAGIDLKKSQVQAKKSAQQAKRPAGAKK